MKYFNHLLINGQNKKFLIIFFDNVSEYDQLSQEFDMMKDIIELFRHFTSKVDNSYLLYQKRQLKSKKQELINDVNKKNLKKKMNLILTTILLLVL